MEFEWSEEKGLKVLSDRHLDLVDAKDIFDGRPAISMSSDRNDEERWLNIAQLNGRMIAVVWCRRGDNIRIITMRRARDAEARRYRELYG